MVFLFCCCIVGACGNRLSTVDNVGRSDFEPETLADERDLAANIALFVASPEFCDSSKSL